MNRSMNCRYRLGQQLCSFVRNRTDNIALLWLRFLDVTVLFVCILNLEGLP